MAKNNVRSFRFDDDILQMIEGFAGQNLSDKFDNLVRFCHSKVPDTEKRLTELEKQIEVKRKILASMTKQTQEIECLITYLKQAKNAVASLADKAMHIDKGTMSHK